MTKIPSSAAPVAQDRMRNFSIIAHIDHGKSTLADRFIELCGGLQKHELTSQVLDTMELEKERGITIKAQTATLRYGHAGETWQLNMIDTPGHVDFSYEVSRSLAACEGALLLVDASQGVEAQSIASCMVAMENDVTVLPVLNKMDLASAEPEAVREQITKLIGIDASDAPGISAKTGDGVGQLLRLIVSSLPAPDGVAAQPLQALIIDSWFDPYHGVVSLVRVVNGAVAVGDEILVLSNGQRHQVLRLGVFTPKSEPRQKLDCGEVGFIIMGVKRVDALPVGDTLAIASEAPASALPGFQRIKPRVFAGIFPSESVKFDDLREAMEKITLNDSALQYEVESSQALGFGLRCGFLGTLHIDIIRERLEREYNLDLLITAPTVVYEWLDRSGEAHHIDNPGLMPPQEEIVELREPVVRVDVYAPQSYVGAVMELCLGKRAQHKDMQYAGNYVHLTFVMPLSEVVLDLFDRLKSASSGYASFDYEFLNYQAADLVRVDLMLNGAMVDAVSFICHRDEAASRGRAMVKAIKKSLKRHMFEIAVQAAIGSKIIARETVSALRKNVTAKCYGGDVSRKRKLLEKQKQGKKRMKQFGNVQLSQEALLSAIKSGRS